MIRKLKVYQIKSIPKNFEAIAKKDLGLVNEDINLGWNTKSELPEEIVDDIFNLKEGEISHLFKVVLDGTSFMFLKLKKEKKLGLKK